MISETQLDAPVRRSEVAVEGVDQVVDVLLRQRIVEVVLVSEVHLHCLWERLVALVPGTPRSRVHDHEGEREYDEEARDHPEQPA